jgi:hypothetical protein
MNVLEKEPLATHTRTQWKVRFYSFRSERWLHFTCGHAIGEIGHGVGHINDVDDSSSFDRAAALIVCLLRSYGFVLVESKGVIIGEVGACNGSGLCVDLGVQALEHALMTLEGARVGGNVGCVLVLHDAQFELVLLAHVSAGGGHVIKACIHAVEFVCGFGMALVGGARINRQIFLLQV